jgi:signal transduction histidine kinase
MAPAEWFRPPRHLLAMFFGITVISATALGWLSWELVRQDRDLASKYAEEGRDAAAERAVAALQTRLSTIEEQLAALADLGDDQLSLKAAEYSSSLAPGTVFLAVHADRVDAYPPDRLLYYPALPGIVPAPRRVFADVEALDRQRDHHGAIGRLRRLSTASDPVVRAEALMRLGSRLRQTSRWQEALAVYDEMAALRDVPTPAGVPAELAARAAIVTILEEYGERDRFARETSSLAADLNSARWRLTRPVYDSYVEALRPVQHAPPDRDAVAFSEAAYALWETSQSGQTAKNRQTFWSVDRPILLLERRSAGRVLAIAIAPEVIESGWLSEAQPARSSDTRIALADRDGRAVLRATVAPNAQSSLRPASATGLPWDLYAVSNDAVEGGIAFSARSRLVVGAVGAIALLVLGGSYLIGRAVSRELAVARLQSDFVSAVSHEFRTPLTVLRQLSELLVQDRVPTDTVRRQYYGVLQQESGRLHRLVEGLLKFGRMEAGVVQFQFETLDAATLVGSVVSEFSGEAERRGRSVELRFEGTGLHVRADRDALGCVVWNLLENAVKYSPDCQTVWVHLAAENGLAAIRVRDRGVGIPLGDRGRIFDKFVRGEAAATLGVQGTGIGLAVARQIVRRHGGEIRLESEVGRGSTFTVLLPLQVAGQRATGSALDVPSQSVGHAG